jgi:hypothetical protein
MKTFSLQVPQTMHPSLRGVGILEMESELHQGKMWGISF